MNPTKLFVLGALARHGPMYGHQIRRDARIDRTELWSDVKPGSLYLALHRLEAEGLIEPVRTEQQGNRPARTVYAITPEGHRELRALRAEALREVSLRPDPVDLALAVSADLDEDTLREFIASRRDVLSGRLASLAREGRQRWPDQTAADDLIMDHLIARIETEVRWHDAVLDRIGKLASGSEAAVGGGAAEGAAEAGRPVSLTPGNGARADLAAPEAAGPDPAAGHGK